MIARSRLGRIFLACFALAVFAYGLVAAQLFVIGENPVEYHVDPLVVKSVDARDQYLAAPPELSAAVPSRESEWFDATPQDVMIAFDAVVMKAPRTKLAAGSPSGMWATYVQRSRLMRFPDYISVAAVGRPEGGATVAVFSQSVYGKGDFGVNKARVDRWLSQLRETMEKRP